MSIALGLARRGAGVTVVDKAWPGVGTSSTSYAWVNANGKEPDSYFELNRAGMEAHYKLAAQGGEWFSPGGHVEFATDEAHRTHLRGRMERLAGRGYEVEALSPEQAMRLVPDVRLPKDCDTIAFFPREAHCSPSLYLAHVLGEALDAGVQLRTQSPVVALSAGDAGAAVTLADGSVLPADRVVAAAGRWTGELAALAGLDVPMATFTSPGDITVGHLLETSPVPVRLNRLLTSPWLNVRPEGGGRLLLQALDLDVTADPADVPSTDSEVARELLARLRSVMRNAESAVARHLVVGQRVMPADGYTIVGPVPRADWFYAVATHSGVTLAPLLGSQVASELCGEEEPLFADFRPARFEAGAPVQPPSAPRKPGEQ
jgi:glycine/D-amino acid oxidase-like deaminating enzyme